MMILFKFLILTKTKKKENRNKIQNEKIKKEGKKRNLFIKEKRCRVLLTGANGMRNAPSIDGTRCYSLLHNNSINPFLSKTTISSFPGTRLTSQKTPFPEKKH